MKHESELIRHPEKKITLHLKIPVIPNIWEADHILKYIPFYFLCSTFLIGSELDLKHVSKSNWCKHSLSLPALPFLFLEFPYAKSKFAFNEVREGIPFYYGI